MTREVHRCHVGLSLRLLTQPHRIRRIPPRAPCLPPMAHILATSTMLSNSGAFAAPASWAVHAQDHSGWHTPSVALSAAVASSGDSSFSTGFINWSIPLAAIAAVLFALVSLSRLTTVRVASASLSADTESGNEPLLGSTAAQHDDIARAASQIHHSIREGAHAFLVVQYKNIAWFMALFACLVFAALGTGNKLSWRWQQDEGGVSRAPKVALGAFTTLAFLLGAGTSLLCGWIGMSIGTYANVRVAVEARRGMAAAFVAAFQGGSAIGCSISGLALLMLYLTIQLFSIYFGSDWRSLFTCVAGYGLGGSSVALFARVGGGTFTKAADVGCDLVGKVERSIPEDDPRNPAVIADQVGDLVGDVAGMSADLFGSFAEASVSALVLSSLSSLGDSHNWTAMCYPLLLAATSLIVCMLTTILALDVTPARTAAQVPSVIKVQLIASATLMSLAALPITYGALPAHITGIFPGDPERAVSAWSIYLCALSGIQTGLGTGLVTEYFTSNAYGPVREVAEAARTGAATSIIFGLALGYKSVVVPILLLGGCVFSSFQMAGFYGVAIAALGVLGNLATALTVDGFGPICDNAGGIAEMSRMGDDVRERTDCLDAAGNTTAAIGKGFAIGSAALVSLALFGSYISQAGVTLADASLLDGKTYLGVLVGAMLPYAFSALTLKGVGNAALSMVDEVRTQFRTIPGLMQGTTRPDYERCVSICTKAALSEMVAPGALVILAPMVTGTLFGTRCLAGLLTGILTSGVQMAISASCSGSSWDNAKKYLEAGATEQARAIGGKGSEPHKASVISDTVGDPLKDTSGPSLNILVKLSAIVSLIMAPFFAQNTADGLVFRWLHVH